MYDNPGGFIAMTVILEVLALAATSLRFYSRRITRAGLEIDDWTFLGGVFLATAMSGVTFWGIAIGAIASKNPNPGFRNVALVELAHNQVYIVASGVLKISITLFYKRIFGKRQSFRKVIDIWLTILVIWTVAFFTAFLFECGTHLHYFWDAEETYRKHCAYVALRIGWGLAVSAALTDLITLILPVTQILRLQMSNTNKARLILIFTVGGVTVAASIVRCYLDFAATTGYIREGGLWSVTVLCVWKVIEVDVGIFAACIPLIGPAVKRICTLSLSFASFSTRSNEIRAQAATYASQVKTSDLPVSQARLESDTAESVEIKTPR